MQLYKQHLFIRMHVYCIHLNISYIKTQNNLFISQSAMHENLKEFRKT